jgi:hypothetical protein
MSSALFWRRPRQLSWRPSGRHLTRADAALTHKQRCNPMLIISGMEWKCFQPFLTPFSTLPIRTSRTQADNQTNTNPNKRNGFRVLLPKDGHTRYTPLGSVVPNGDVTKRDCGAKLIRDFLDSLWASFSRTPPPPKISVIAEKIRKAPEWPGDWNFLSNK